MNNGTKLALAVGKHMGTMLASAIVLITVLEGATAISIWNQMRKEDR